MLRVLENGISSYVDVSNMPCGINFAIYFFVTQGPYSNIGSRSYLMEDNKEYKLLRVLKNGISSTLT